MLLALDFLDYPFCREEARFGVRLRRLVKNPLLLLGFGLPLLIPGLNILLFPFAILGGSVGAILGMRVWHHKTRHWYFKYGLPAILLAQLALAWYLGGLH